MSARVGGAALLLALAASARPLAHDIPNDVIVQAFLKPEGQRLHLVMRVPMEALRDIDVPQRDRGYLDLTRVDDVLRTAATVWIAQEVALYEEEARLGSPEIVAVRISLPSDRSFQQYDTAVAHLRGPPLPAETDLYWEQGILDVWLEYPIASDVSRFAINPGLRPLGQRVTIALRLLTPDGRERAFELHDDPGIVRLDPRWHQAAARFVHSGFEHILGGIDHLLFLLCLVIPLRRVKTLVIVVTSFTVAHSITLIAAAYNLGPDGLWFPPLVETLIAMSIVYMALENIVGASFTHRWLITFAFGLVHGFGFSFALRETLQFAGSHLLLSLVSFNVGVELGQLLVLAVVVPALRLLFRAVAARVATVILSVIVAHTAWHWMTDRGAQLMEFPLPALDAVLLLWLVRTALVLVALAGLVWAARAFVRSRTRRSGPAEAAPYVPEEGRGVRL